MKFAKIVCLTILVGFATQVIAAGADGPNVAQLEIIKPYLPQAGEQSADLLQLAITGQNVQILTKMQKAMAKNQDWFVKYAQTVPKGKPMPYHKNLGVSQKEYELFLEQSQTSANLKMQKVGTVNLLVEGSQAQGLSIRIMNVAQVLLSAQISPGGELTVEGFPKIASPSTFENKNSPFGPSKGISWRFEEGDLRTKTGTVVQFTLSKNDKSGLRYMSVDLMKVENGAHVFPRKDFSISYK